MPIDASIYNQVKMPPSPLDQMADVSKLKEAQQNQQINALKLSQAQQSIQDQHLLDQAYQKFTTPDGNIDYQGMAKSMAASGQGHLAPGLIESGTKVQESMANAVSAQAKAESAQRDVAGRLGLQMQGLLDKGAPLEDVAAVGYTHLAALGKSQLIAPNDLAAMTRSLDPSNPDVFKRTVAGMISASPEASKLTAEAKTAAKPNTASLYLSAAGGDPAKAVELMNQAKGTSNAEWKPVMLDGKPTQVTFDPKTQKVKDLSGNVIDNPAGRITPIPAASIQVQNTLADRDAKAGAVTAARPDPKIANVPDPTTGLTPNALYQNALEFATMGKMPPAGFGQSARALAQKGDIQNKAGAIAAAAGVDLPTVQAEYKANSAALSKIVPIATMTAASAGAAKDNLQLALDESNQVGRSPSKLLNKPWQVLQSELTPAKDLSKLELYIYTAAREYAKVVSGSAASSVGLTDTAAKEAEKLLNASQAPGTFAAVAEGMQNDMDNQTRNQTKQISAVSQTLGRFFGAVTEQESGGSPAAQPAAPAAKPNVGDTKTFNGSPYKWNGSAWALQKQ